MVHKKNDKSLRKRVPKNGEPKKLRRGSLKDKQSGLDRWFNPSYFMVLLLPIVVATGMLYWYRMVQLKEMVRKPLNKPLITQHGVHSDMSRYWGSYRSNLYFGLKTRHPKSPVVGKCCFTSPYNIRYVKNSPVDLYSGEFC